MGVTKERIVLATCGLALFAGSVTALVHERESDSPLQAKEFIASALDVTPVNGRPTNGITTSELDSLGAHRDTAFLDTRGGRWRTLLFALPIIPGTGVGNDLTWDAGHPADDEALGELTWQRVRAFVANNAASLRIDVDELTPRIAVHNGGEMVQIWANRHSSGLPVRGAGLSVVVNKGNLVLMGAELWGDIELQPLPSILPEAALDRVASFVAPMRIDALREDSTLAILPASSGDGYTHHLAWVVRPTIPGDIGQWEALVDAHSGELLSLQDLNHYGTARSVKGGVYPLAYDGVDPGGNMVQNYPMPFANVDSGGFTDAGGNFNAAGNVTTTLNGQYIRIQEFCGAVSESSTGDIDLEGTDGDVNCTVPPGHSVGDTSSARSGFYELNRIKSQARGQITNGWVDGTLTAQMNISPTCNAFWTGTVVQFFREQGICANTGQIAGVFDHEWGHGMDDNDVVGTIPGTGQGGGEGMADIYAALRLNMGCVGRGFFLNGMTCGGYGDPCTPASGCTGVRSIDFADRASGVPHTLTWVRTSGSCGSSHCTGAAYSETVWDLLKRHLPALHGMDDNTALEVTTRLTYIGAGNATGWFDRTGPPPGAAGCGAGQGYMQFLAADDDDGNIANGTPHMDAIAAAFDAHEIGCTPANGGPTVTVNGCAGTPTDQPVVTVASTDMGADLSWDPITGAASYNVYRTDGERACDFGKERVASTTGTTFSDSGLMNGRPYYYVVVPMGAGGESCFGPASDCAATMQETPLFTDGFEGGNTDAWSLTIPLIP